MTKFKVIVRRTDGEWSEVKAEFRLDAAKIDFVSQPECHLEIEVLLPTGEAPSLRIVQYGSSHSQAINDPHFTICLTACRRECCTHGMG